MAEATAYIEMSLDPEVQRIVLLDGSAVLVDPSEWPSQDSCLEVTRQTVKRLMEKGIIKSLNAEAAACLLIDAALNAALWVAASEDAKAVLLKAVEAFQALATVLLRTPL
ncbi:hypothetical protein J5289_05060 [Rhizobium sp. B230/85]|nr:hypothetical protein [Rhizobium sp. B209b/85]QXZ96949.1 hypothetical protein J5289_05060 [Rhizobium sp. B230/85]